MTNEPMVHAAEERLLDAALTQAFARKRDRTAARPSHPQRWLLAALFLLGIGITATTMWQARSAQRNEAQDPSTSSMAPEKRAEGKAAIEALPVDTENLLVELKDPRDLSAVRRLRSLRRLVVQFEFVHIGPIRTNQVHRLWREPPENLLEVIDALPQLECLWLTWKLALSPTLLSPLAKHQNLRELSIAGEEFDLDQAIVDALRAIPNLRSLHILGARLDTAAARRLQALPLTALEVSQCPGFDAAAFAELMGPSRLERLAFRGLGATPLGIQDSAATRPGVFDLQGLRKLTNLRALSFESCDLRDDDLLALPDTVHELRLLAHELTAAGLAHLQRFGALRKLELGIARKHVTFVARESAEEQRAAADAVAAAIAKLRLRDLSLFGPLSPSLMKALAEQPDLEVLVLSSNRISDLTGLAQLPGLRSLTLSENGSPGDLTLDALRPLGASPGLRTLRIHAFDLDASAVKGLFPKHVSITVENWK
jgi:Leucine Rich repeats (2 copies)